MSQTLKALGLKTLPYKGKIWPKNTLGSMVRKQAALLL